MATITTAYKGDMLFLTQIGSHSMVTDVPAPMGGKDRAPTPPELFIASLGTCVGALVAQYCGRNGVNADDMTVAVDYKKADQPTRLTDLVVTINLPHASCQDREAAIRRVAEHCPVHQTIVTLEDVQFNIYDHDHPLPVAEEALKG
ncbi:MAG: OsmC family protein [Anaerolineae bacterium]|nr:OsmC family protein [Anaerolineae bacterium]